jgi:hypothetical protein
VEHKHRSVAVARQSVAVVAARRSVAVVAARRSVVVAVARRCDYRSEHQHPAHRQPAHPQRGHRVVDLHLSLRDLRRLHMPCCRAAQRKSQLDRGVTSS